MHFVLTHDGAQMRGTVVRTGGEESWGWVGGWGTVVFMSGEEWGTGGEKWGEGMEALSKEVKLGQICAHT